MNLNKDRFYKTDCLFYLPNEQVLPIEGTIYSYESKKALYDVAVIAGGRAYQTNMRGFSGEKGKYHELIEEHFNL